MLAGNASRTSHSVHVQLPKGPKQPPCSLRDFRTLGPGLECSSVLFVRLALPRLSRLREPAQASLLPWVTEGFVNKSGSSPGGCCVGASDLVQSVFHSTGSPDWSIPVGLGVTQPGCQQTPSLASEETHKKMEQVPCNSAPGSRGLSFEHK